ncbi:MAG: hypothetical protein ACKO70_09700 [Actinomycetota bacterium]
MTGLLYVAIVALWAAVLIPMWLRRHDDDQARRIERHRTAMGALARMPETTGRGAAATAARRRNVVLGALAGLVVATGAAWALGYASGWFVTASMVLLASYSAGAFVAHRVRIREESLRALERSSAAREARRDRHRMRPVPSAPDVVDQRPTAVSPSVQGETWDEVFDQTA